MAITKIIMRFTPSLISISLLMLLDYAIAANTINVSRKALVIGNANYPEQGLFTQLSNPVHDATGMAQRLREYGFTVTRVVNVDPAAMEQAIDTFVDSLNKNDVAAVYYSGHGGAITCRKGEEQRNYLIPVAKVFNNAADVCDRAVSAQWLLDRLNERDGGMNMLLLDSCRNVIAANKGFNNKGFVEMHGTGTFIGYASAPGQTAKGDTESEYSIFTGQLLEVLKAPNDKLPLELLFKRVRTAVANMAEDAGIQQVPWSDNGLVGEEDFCFSSQCVEFTDVVPEATVAQLQREREQLEAELQQLREQIAVQKSKDEPVKVKRQSVPQQRQNFEPANNSESEIGMYNKSFEKLKAGEYAKAITDFNAQLVAYPRGQYTDNAQYWLGEMYYATRNFDSAMLAFNQVIEQYPNSNKVAGATLKLGFIHYERGQAAKAIELLEQVIANFPNSVEATLAQQKIKLIR